MTAALRPAREPCGEDAEPSAWALCSALLRRLDPAADVLAVSAAGSMLRHHLRSVVEADRLFLHEAAGPPPAPMALVPDPVEVAADHLVPLLGEQDRDREPAMQPWPWSPRRPVRRVRRVDTLYADSHRLGLLALAGADIPGVLRGAARVLAGQRPTLLLDLGAVARGRRPGLLEEVFTAVGAATYAWHSGSTLPHEAPRCGRQSPRCGTAPLLVAVPHQGGKPLASVVAWPQPLTPVRSITVAFDEALPAAGLYPAETDGSGRWWRWTGPGARCSFALPMPGAGRWTLRLSLRDWGAVGGADGLQVYGEGHRLELRAATGNTAEFGGIRSAPEAVPEVVRITVVTRTTRPDSRDDARRSGVCLQAASLLREEA